MKRIVSFSGGKDSTAMLLLLIQEKIKFDEVVYFDSGSWEFPAMREHIKLVEKKTGLKITKIKPEKSFEYWFWQHWPEKKHSQPHLGKSWPSAIRRWCTREKTVALDKYCGGAVRYIGIAYDEIKRIQSNNMKKLNAIFPLIDYKINEKQALDLCYVAGFDWGGLYTHFNRVSCWCCPLQSLQSLQSLYIHYPKLWERLKMIDELTWQSFRKDYSILELENRFKKRCAGMEL